MLIRGYAQEVETWLTTHDRSSLFSKQPASLKFENTSGARADIIIDEKQSYQTMDGFGFALTGGSAMHIVRMNPDARAALLKELFGTDGNNIGVSYIRLSVGASDLNEKVFSYNDLPPGETDHDMLKFDLGPDRQDVIPVMKEILAINPKILIMASPWSPPTWMKTNNDTRGGRLKADCYAAYAKYFVKYVKAMEAEGIRIDAITVQNEPLHPGNNPSLLMPAPDQADFIKYHLGPHFKNAGIKTKIVVYDHNADRPDYPLYIFDDKEAAQYVDGSAFHLYNGEMNALSDVHDQYPQKNLYFSEQMVIEEPNKSTIDIYEPVSRLIIAASRNWCKNVLLWNLAADPENKPFTDRGGCPMCQGAVTIDGSNFTRNLAYYTIAHASKFVPMGSVRIGSNESLELPNVAFKTPSNKIVLIVSNTGNSDRQFTIRYKGKSLQASLTKGSVGTYVF